jgi:CheY-like chemotaxis protein
MDLQKPEKDGFQTTRIIRQDLKIDQLPIIALTDHALSDDREKCFTAGMTGYLTKPIDWKQLFSVLNRHVLGEKNHLEVKLEAANAQGYMKTSRNVPGFDIKEGLARVGGSYNRYVKILKEFFGIYKDIVSDLRKLIENNEFEAVRLKAHSLRGAACNIAAMDLGHAAKGLEEASTIEAKSQMFRALDALERAFSKVSASFESVACSQNAAELKASESDGSDSSKLFGLFRKLNRSLEALDPIETEICFKEIKSCLPSKRHSTNISNLERQILGYQFDTAKETLRKLSDEFKGVCGGQESGLSEKRMN